MSNKIFLFLFFCFFSCQSQQKDSSNLYLISAERSFWYGGRPGVGGINYKIILKNNEQNTPVFETLNFEKLNLQTRTETKGKNIIITAEWQNNVTSEVDEKTGSILPKPSKPGNSATLVYHYKNSSKKLKILIPSFIDTPQKSEEPL